MISSQVSDSRVAIDRNCMLQFLEQQIIRHRIAKSDAVFQFHAELPAQSLSNHCLVLGIQDILGQYLFLRRDRKSGSLNEIESVTLEMARIEIGGHRDQ